MNINLGFMKGVLFYGVFMWIYSGKNFKPLVKLC